MELRQLLQLLSWPAALPSGARNSPENSHAGNGVTSLKTRVILQAKSHHPWFSKFIFFFKSWTFRVRAVHIFICIVLYLFCSRPPAEARDCSDAHHHLEYDPARIISMPSVRAYSDTMDNSSIVLWCRRKCYNYPWVPQLRLHGGFWLSLHAPLKDPLVRSA